MLMIRRPNAGPSALLKTTLVTVFLFGTAAAGAAQAPVTSAATSTAAPAASASSDSGYHDLICKPNGTEDGFDCADEATPAKIVPIPSQLEHVRTQDQAVSA